MRVRTARDRVRALMDWERQCHHWGSSRCCCNGSPHRPVAAVAGSGPPPGADRPSCPPSSCPPRLGLQQRVVVCGYGMVVGLVAGLRRGAPRRKWLLLLLAHSTKTSAEHCWVEQTCTQIVRMRRLRCWMAILARVASPTPGRDGLRPHAPPQVHCTLLDTPLLHSPNTQTPNSNEPHPQHPPPSRHTRGNRAGASRRDRHDAGVNGQLQQGGAGDM